MNTITGKNLHVLTDFPRILQGLAKEVRRNKVTEDADFNVFATRYFAALANVGVEGHPTLEIGAPRDITVYRMGREEVEGVDQTPPQSASFTAQNEGLREEERIEVGGPGTPSGPQEPDLTQLLANARERLGKQLPEDLELAREVFTELCALRQNPSAYATKVEGLKTHFLPEESLFIIPGGVVLSSKEGWSAYEECIAELRTCSPLPPLEHSIALMLASLEGLDEGNDNVPAREMAGQYGRFSEELGSSVAQSLCFNQLLAQSIILHLLVDDNYPSRGNRKNLLSEEYQHVGISYQSATCNVIFASNFTIWPSVEHIQEPVEPGPPSYLLKLDNKMFRAISGDDLGRELKRDVLTEPPVTSPESAVVETEVGEQALKITLLEPRTTETTVEQNFVEFVLEHSAGSLTAQLTSTDGTAALADKSCLIQSRGGLAALTAFFPQPGLYTLAVSADLKGEGVYTQVLEYKVEAKCGTSAMLEGGFPNTFLQSHDCYCYTPTQAVLEEGMRTFVVQALKEIPGIAVLTGNQLVYLEKHTREGQTYWAGSVNLKQGPVKVATFISRTHYEVFSYVVPGPDGETTNDEPPSMDHLPGEPR